MTKRLEKINAVSMNALDKALECVFNEIDGDAENEEVTLMRMETLSGITHRIMGVLKEYDPELITHTLNQFLKHDTDNKTKDKNEKYYIKLNEEEIDEEGDLFYAWKVYERHGEAACVIASCATEEIAVAVAGMANGNKYFRIGYQ